MTNTTTNRPSFPRLILFLIAAILISAGTQIAATLYHSDHAVHRQAR